MASVSIQDALAKVEDMKNAYEKYQADKAQAAEILEADARFLKQFIQNTANPNPIMVAFTLFFIAVCMYVLYYMFYMKSIVGLWEDEDGNRVEIQKKVFSDILYVKETNLDNDGNYNVEYEGSINGNLVYLGSRKGVWDNLNTILFINGGELMRVI